MPFDTALIAGKLRRWEKYLNNYRLPAWEDIPDFGLYMKQLVIHLKEYLDYLPPELKDEACITSATINNYVRTKVMPEPRNRRYYRLHLAYLILICSLKQGLGISLIHEMLPNSLTEEEMRVIYTNYAERHQIVAQYFVEQVRMAAAPILAHETIGEYAVTGTEDLILSAAIAGGFARLLAEKLLLLDGRTLKDGGSIEIRP